MIGRSFVVVDDIINYALKVEKGIRAFYEEKGLHVWEYDIVKITSKKIFSEAKEYVERSFNKIDVIFCDQNLKKHLGTELFREINKMVIKTEYESIVSRILIYKALHSLTSIVFFENQRECSETCDYLVKSVDKKSISECLNFYEESILKVKQEGNFAYKNYLHQKNSRSRLFDNEIIIDDKLVRLRDILILVLDPSRGNSDYYYFIYKNGDEIIRTNDSRKPEYYEYNLKKDSFNASLNELFFIKGTLALDKNAKQDKSIMFKVNPLWFAAIDFMEKEIKLLPICSKRFEIKFNTVDEIPPALINKKLDDFFLKNLSQ